MYENLSRKNHKRDLGERGKTLRRIREILQDKGIAAFLGKEKELIARGTNRGGRPSHGGLGKSRSLLTNERKTVTPPGI